RRGRPGRRDRPPDRGGELGLPVPRLAESDRRAGATSGGRAGAARRPAAERPVRDSPARRGGGPPPPTRNARRRPRAGGLVGRGRDRRHHLFRRRRTADAAGRPDGPTAVPAPTGRRRPGRFATPLLAGGPPRRVWPFVLPRELPRRIRRRRP